MASFCAANGIAMLPYGVLAGGLPCCRAEACVYEKWGGVVWAARHAQAAWGCAEAHCAPLYQSPAPLLPWPAMHVGTAAVHARR
jgi:hypothetical protein